jgi:hypothetical protein
VNINDKMSKILEVLENDNVQGFLTFEGKLIQSPGDITFAKKFVQNNAKFALITAEGSFLKPTQWLRFSEFYYTDYFYMNTRYWDAVVFIPKRNIIFYGWGVFANFNGADVDLKVQW